MHKIKISRFSRLYDAEIDRRYALALENLEQSITAYSDITGLNIKLEVTKEDRPSILEKTITVSVLNLVFEDECDYAFYQLNNEAPLLTAVRVYPINPVRPVKREKAFFVGHDLSNLNGVQTLPAAQKITYRIDELAELT